MFSAFYQNLPYFLFCVSTLYISTYLFSYIQTIRNIISFAALVFCLASGIGLAFGIHYYPLFLMLTYLGAIIVVTLFVVLTFDIRLEYKQKKTYTDDMYGILGLAEVISGIFWAGWLLLRRANVHSSAVGDSSVSPEDLELAFSRCLKIHGEKPSVCNDIFARPVDASLYQSVSDYTNDLQVVSSNLYTNYSFLFICLAIALSLSLMSALTILRQQ